MMPNEKENQMASQLIFQFYAELDDYEPRIWRRFQVLNNISMARLGYILMTMFEMQASHLFCFDIPFADNFRLCIENHADSAVNIKAADIFEDRPELSVIHIELPNEDDIALPGQRTMDAANTMVKHAVDRENERLTFSYDYGDGWEIKLILEEIIEDKALPGKELPRVLDGAGYGIIEDCGGTGGLTELAKAFKTKKGPRYKELSKWLGTDTLELDSFDMDDMNFRLKKVPRIYKDIYEYDLAPTKQSIDLLERKYKQSK
jgi:hypothetical protein